jgi:hypothetical protein
MNNATSLGILAIHSTLLALALLFTFANPQLLQNQTWDYIIVTLTVSVVGHSISTMSKS